MNAECTHAPIRVGMKEQMELIQSELQREDVSWAFVLMRIDLMKCLADAALADTAKDIHTRSA